MEYYLNHLMLGNTLQEWLLALAAFAATWFGLWLARNVFAYRLNIIARRTSTAIDDFLVTQLDLVDSKVFIAVSLYVAGGFLRLSAFVGGLIISLNVVVVVATLIAFWKNSVKQSFDKSGTPQATTSMLKNLSLIVQFALWFAAGLIILDNLGFEISTLLAGLGVGGIAMALAAQTILGDLFNCFSIYLDKPFIIGDFIIVGEQMGVVEHVGLKTTRIRSLSGEQLVFSNTDLTNSRIRNFKRMQERRVTFKFGITYQTPPLLVRRIPAMVRLIVEKRPSTRFEFAVFREFGDSSLDFEVVYYLLTGDFKIYVETQQEINLALMEAFAAEHIDFAYPTRTIVMARTTESMTSPIAGSRKPGSCFE